MRRRLKISDAAFNIINGMILIAFALFCLYPIVYTLSVSISNPEAVRKMEVWFFPKGFSTKSFSLVFKNEYILTSYVNAIVYTIGGTIYSMVLTILGAFVLSRKRFIGRNFFMFAIWFTMVFSGGIIPTYLIVNDLNMINTAWAIIIPAAVSQYYLIIMRTAMEAVPASLEESAKIDGANDFIIMYRIIIPVVIPTISTILLFYIVAKWNSYFTALIYLNKKELFPLQLILREMLVTMTDSSVDRGIMGYDQLKNFTPLGFKGAVIMVSLFPMLILYPFIQKYFVKGIMIGAIKG